MMYLNNEVLKKRAHSIFTTEKSPHVSSKYSLLPTVKVIDDMKKLGWFPVRAREQHTRTSGRQGFQKHFVVFRPHNYLDIGQFIDNSRDPIIPEIVGYNGHDGHNAFYLYGGLFRTVSMTGLLFTGIFAPVRVTHINYTFDELQRTVKRYISSYPDISNLKQQWDSIRLAAPDRLYFAKQALALRWPQGTTINPEQLLVPRRPQDMGTTLWKVFTTVQENVFVGGIRGKNRKGRKMTTRKLERVDAYIKLNRDLWTLAETVASKAAA